MGNMWILWPGLEREEEIYAMNLCSETPSSGSWIDPSIHLVAPIQNSQGLYTLPLPVKDSGTTAYKYCIFQQELFFQCNSQANQSSLMREKHVWFDDLGFKVKCYTYSVLWLKDVKEACEQGRMSHWIQGSLLAVLTQG